MIRKAISILCILAILMLVLCIAYPLNEFHFAWIGMMFGSLAGLLAVFRSYHTEDKVSTRGGVVYKKDSPIQFFISYRLIGFVCVGFLLLGILGGFGLVK